MDTFLIQILLAGLIVGASTGLLGVYVVGMRIPFIGTAISHAAMAGIVYGKLFAINPMFAAAAASGFTGLTLGLGKSGNNGAQVGIRLAIVFTLALGLTFVGIGLSDSGRADIMGLLWGSILFVNTNTLFAVAILGLILALFTAIFNKELKAILFSRTIAAATGIHQQLIYASFLVLCGLVLAFDLRMVGGLMIFGLMVCPAAAAYEIANNHKQVVTISIILGATASLGGLALSYCFDLPAGGCIVTLSALIYWIAAAYAKIRCR
jgi:manganese/iron transport system permease protein